MSETVWVSAESRAAIVELVNAATSARRYVVSVEAERRAEGDLARATEAARCADALDCAIADAQGLL